MDKTDAELSYKFYPLDKTYPVLDSAIFRGAMHAAVKLSRLGEGHKFISVFHFYVFTLLK